MRTFIALDLSNELIEQVADLSRQLSSMVRGRFVARSTYHVTLAFLGEIGEPEARRVMDVLDTACAHAAAFDPHVTLARRARVLPQALSDLVFPAESSSNSVTLYKSELSQEGATYKPLYTVHLG